MNIDIFQCTDSVEDMEQSLRVDGLIGISGGRVSVRRALNDTVDRANGFSDEEVRYVGLTFSHPDTELAYIWDTHNYSLKQAESIVQEKYERDHA